MNQVAIRFALTVALCLLTIPTRAASSYKLSSPDGRIAVSIQMPKSGSPDRPSWSATFRGEALLTDCQLGLQTARAGELFAGVAVKKQTDRSVNERIAVLPGDGKSETATIVDETTSFGVVGNPTAYAQYLENYKTSHEHNVTNVPCAALRAATLLDLPLTLSWTNGTCAAITEAALRNYAGMALMRSSNTAASTQLTCKLSPRPEGTKVAGPLPLKTPWRVVLVGDRPGALLESGTIYCLNEPSVIKDISWIKPGKITFSWWNGDVYDGEIKEPILGFDMAKRYIDFCASNNIPTHSLIATERTTSPWYFQSNKGTRPGPDTDVTRPRADFDLPKIRAYAESKNIRLWTWVHQGALRGRVEEAFAAFEKMGWNGMMVDFFDHDDQANVEFAESILQAAARHHIMIHFHGVWKPTGLERTYPNLMNHEGALNLEYLKWSNKCTPDHNLLMAFTRLVAGPMDYHLGGFRAVTAAEFKPQNIAPTVLGTRCHHLAMYVCFDNPNPMLADYPVAYEGQPGFDFLKLVPTYWDETRVLVGEIGEVLVTARRKGDTWYVGCMSAKQPREVVIPLSFLGKGDFTANVWQDATDASSNPNHLTRVNTKVTHRMQLKIPVAKDGGFVAQLTPSKK